MGTEGYAALEQYQRKAQDPSTGIYAAAATWYRLLSGKTPMAVVERVGEDPDPLSPPSSHGVDLPPEVESVWLKGMAVLPQDRWAAVDDLQTALQVTEQEKIDAITEAPPEEPAAKEEIRLGADQGKGEVQELTPSEKPPREKGRVVRTLIWTVGSVVVILVAYWIYTYMHDAPVAAMAVSYDQREVVTISYDEIKRWEIPGGEYIGAFNYDIGWHNHVATSPDGRYMALAGTDGVILWDMESGEITRELGDKELVTLYAQEPHTGAVRRVAFSPDSATVLTAGDDVTLKLWDIENGRVIGTYYPEALATSIAFSPNGRSAVSGSREGPAQLWNTATHFLDSIFELRTLVYLLPVDVGGLNLFDIISTTTKSIRTFDIESSTVVAFAPDGQSFASGGTDGIVTIWDVSSGETTDQFTDHDNAITALAYGPDGDVVASGDTFGYIKVWRLDTGEKQNTIQPESDIWFQPVISLTLLDDSLISSNGETVRVLSATSGEELNSFRVVMPEKLF